MRRVINQHEAELAFLLWAMTLRLLRDQWKRVVFMQTNREDVGKRWLEIEIPVPVTRAAADEISRPFGDYYTAIAAARDGLIKYWRLQRAPLLRLRRAETPEPEVQGAVAAGTADEVDEDMVAGERPV